MKGWINNNKTNERIVNSHEKNIIYIIMKINASVVTFMSPNVYRYMNVYTGT